MIKLVLTIAFVLLATPAWAIDFTPTGSILSVTYTEPTVNTDSSTLNDLSHTNVYHRICPATGPCSEPFTRNPDVTATSVTGGQNITTPVTVGIVAGQERSVEVYATATDLSGNESPESLHVTRRVDRLAPGAPR